MFKFRLYYEFYKILFVEETLDTHLRRLCEWLIHKLDLGYLAVGREYPVGYFAYMLYLGGLGSLVESGLLHCILIDIHKCNKLGCTIHNDGLDDIFLGVQNGLHLFWIDVLAIGGQYHIL